MTTRTMLFVHTHSVTWDRSLPMKRVTCVESIGRDEGGLHVECSGTIHADETTCPYCGEAL